MIQSLPKHIRLIELFCGIGAQAKAMEILNADFEHWRTCEWSIHSIIAYNAIHIKDFSDHSSGMTYEEVLNAIVGVSSDYNKPMTVAELKRRGEPWARRIYSSMVAIHDLKPDVNQLHASDLDIREREREIPIYSPIHFHAKIYPLQDNDKGWKEEHKHEVV